MSKINNGKTSQKDKPYNVLLILDDVANDKQFAFSATIKKLYGRGRHSFISIICVAQQLHSLATIQRSNSDFLICGQINSSNMVNNNHHHNRNNNDKCNNISLKRKKKKLFGI